MAEKTMVNGKTSEPLVKPGDVGEYSLDDDVHMLDGGIERTTVSYEEIVKHNEQYRDNGERDWDKAKD